MSGRNSRTTLKAAVEANEIPAFFAILPGPLQASGPQYARDSAGADHSRSAGIGERNSAIRMTGGERAHQGMSGTRPKACPPGGKVSSVLSQHNRPPVGDGLADAVVSEVAPEAFRKGIPPLTPFLRCVHPLPDRRAPAASPISGTGPIVLRTNSPKRSLWGGEAAGTGPTNSSALSKMSECCSPGDAVGGLTVQEIRKSEREYCGFDAYHYPTQEHNYRRRED